MYSNSGARFNKFKQKKTNKEGSFVTGLCLLEQSQTSYNSTAQVW